MSCSSTKATVQGILEDFQTLLTLLREPSFVLNEATVDALDNVVNLLHHHLDEHALLSQYKFCFPVTGKNIEFEVIGVLREVYEELIYYPDAERICDEIDNLIQSIHPFYASTWSSRMDMGKRKKNRKNSKVKPRRRKAKLRR